MHTMEKRFRHERFASGKGGRGDREGKRGEGGLLRAAKHRWNQIGSPNYTLLASYRGSMGSSCRGSMGSCRVCNAHAPTMGGEGQFTRIPQPP